MAASDKEPAGFIVLRAWIEPDNAHRLRVRIIRLGQGDEAGTVVHVCASVDEACAVIRAWLVALEEGPKL